jgi:hypothetical protein
MDLNKHIVTNNTSKPFHSNGFADAANSNHFGATTSESFAQRRQIDRNRQAIQNYQRSSIGNAYGVLRAKPAPIVRHIAIGRSAPRATPVPVRRYNPFP